jgi:hypothetical protein
MERFSPGVADKLGHYVYRLIDPRNGMTFYVGRGRGDRIFSHANGTAATTELEDDESLKKKIITSIRNDHFDVQHVIHRHGMDENTAREVEGAVIDAYLGLSNIQSGYAPERSVQHADQINRLYTAKEAILLENVLMININQRIQEVSIIDAVRYAWKVSKTRAEKARYILAINRGIIVGVFVAEKWLPATPHDFPGFPETDPTRFGFIAREAPSDAQDRYLHRRIPPAKRGAANPIRYGKPTA